MPNHISAHSLCCDTLCGYLNHLCGFVSKLLLRLLSIIVSRSGILMHFTVFLDLTLVLATGASSVLGKLRQNDLGDNNTGASNLTYSTSPVGPADFETEIRQTRIRLDKKLCLEAAAGIIGTQALEMDWNSRLDERRMIWAAVASGIRVVADSVGTQLMERRFVLWSLLQIVDAMAQTNRYVATVAEVYWHGSMVGTVYIQTIQGISDVDGSRAQKSDTLMDLAEKNLGRDTVRFESVAHFGPPNPMEDVFIGAIVALINAAERFSPNTNIGAFVGSWPGSRYSIKQIWWTTDRPSHFRRGFFMLSIIQALKAAVESNDYSCLKGIVTVNGQYIGEGGYMKQADPPHDGGRGTATS